jgi:hypothetical protein
MPNLETKLIAAAEAINAELSKSYIGQLQTNLAELNRQIDAIHADLVEVAQQRDRLRSQLNREADDQAKRGALIESIPHGGLKVLARLMNNTADIERMLSQLESQWLDEFVGELMKEGGETGAAEVVRVWTGGKP